MTPVRVALCRSIGVMVLMVNVMPRLYSEQGCMRVGGGECAANQQAGDQNQQTFLHKRYSRRLQA